MPEFTIPLYKIYFDDLELENLKEVIESGKYWTGGHTAKKFEEKIATLAKKTIGLSFNSGTSALFALMKALEFQPGDEVIVPSFTFIATSNSVIFGNANPVFAEIENSSFGLDPQDVNERITSKTKAIFPIHYGGGACRIQELREIATDNNLILIEDAAEALGGTVGNIPIGSLGDFSMFSFCGNKVVTTGEGGMLVTDDTKLANKISLLRSHGRDDRGTYFQSNKSFDYVTLGHNWRMSDITAAVGLAQLTKLDFLISERQNKASHYSQKLKNCTRLSIPKPKKEDSHTFQMYTILLKDSEDRDPLKDYLAENGIMSKIYFDCVHLTSYYRNRYNYKEGDLPITEDISKRVLTLPIFPTLKTKEIDFVSNKILDFFST